MGHHLPGGGEGRRVAGAAQPVVGPVEPQPAALMRAYARHRLRAAVDTSNEPDERTVLERVHRGIANIRTRRDRLPTALARYHGAGSGVGATRGATAAR